MLDGVADTAEETIDLIGQIRQLMDDYKREIRAQFPRMYSKDLLENLFKHPYTKIDYLQNDLGVSYLTARKYLETLQEAGFLKKYQLGKRNLYINEPLFNLFVKR